MIPMPKYLEIDKNVVKFDFYKGGIALLKDGKLLLNEAELEFNAQSFFVKDDLIFSSRNFYLDNLRFKYLKNALNVFFTNKICNSLITVTDNNFFYLYDLKNEEIVGKFVHFEDRSLYFLFEDKFICSGVEFITAHSNSDGNEFWRVETKDLLEAEETTIFHNRILLIKEKLFFWIRDKHFRKYCTFVIDANTGKVLHSTEKFGGTIYLYGNYVHSISGKGYSRIDVDSYNVEVYDLTDQLAEDDLNIESGFSFFYNDKIYFAARSGNVNLRSFLGIIDINTQELLWKIDLLKNPDKPADNDNRYQIEEIKANDRFIAVKTAGGTLLVFEQD